MKIYTIVKCNDGSIEHVWFGASKDMAEFQLAMASISRPGERYVMLEEDIGEWVVSE